MKIKNIIGAIKTKFRSRLSTQSFSFTAVCKKDGGGKGADIWGTDWPIPVAEKLEWTICTTTFGRMYIRTKLTDYILWIIPFSYSEYLFSVPNGVYDYSTFGNKEAVEVISLCDNWNHHDDMKNITSNYNAFAINWMNKRWIYEFGNNDYQFIVKD